MKGAAINAAYLVLVIGLFLFASLVIFYRYFNFQNIEANRATCSAKLLNYCTEWWKNGFKKVPYNWNDVEPKDCSNDPIGIFEPTEEECKGLVR